MVKKSNALRFAPQVWAFAAQTKFFDRLEKNS
jgi:hypothetical protein